MGKRKADGKDKKVSKKTKTEENTEIDVVDEQPSVEKEEIIENNNSQTNSTKKDKKNKKDKKDKKNKKDKKTSGDEEKDEVAPVTPSKDTPKSEKKKSKKSKDESSEVVEEDKKNKKNKKNKMEVESNENNDKDDNNEDDGFVIRKPDNNIMVGQNKMKFSNNNNNNNTNAEPTNRLFISGIPYSYKEEQMRDVFGKYGEIVDVFLPSFPDTGKPKGFGFVSFSSNEEAAKACEVNGQFVDGKQLRVELSQQKPRDGGKFGGGGDRGGNKNFNKGGDRGFKNNRGGDRNNDTRRKNVGPLDGSNAPEDCSTLFVGNLSFKVQDDDVYSFFKDNEVKQIRYVEDKQTGQFKGSAFIDFGTRDAAIKAGQLNGQQLLGREVYLDFAKPRN